MGHFYSGALPCIGDGTIIFGSEKHTLVYSRIAHLYVFLAHKKF